MVSLDIYVNETTRHADVILPGLSPLEQSHYDVILRQLAIRNVATYSPPTFDPPAGQLPEWQTVLRLAAIVAGQDGDADVAALEASPHGIDLGPLEPRIPEVLRTPSGKIELAPEPIAGDVERLRAALARPDGQLMLIGRRDLRSNNSWMHNLRVLVKGNPRCTAQINPADAARLAIADGELARVTSRAGAIELPVEVTEAIMPGVVSIPHGWGHDLPGVRLGVAAAHAGANSNRLADEMALDPLSGNAVLNGLAVTVERAAP